MFSKLPYVTKRYNKYGIRVRVPDEVRAIINKKEITRSLGTGDPERAKLIYHEKLKEVLDEIDVAKRLVSKSEPPPLTSDMATLFATTHFQQQIYESENLAHKAQNSIGAIEIEAGIFFTKKELYMEVCLDLKDARAMGQAYAIAIADAILKGNGFPEIIIPHTASTPRSFRQRTRKKVHVDRTSTSYDLLLRLCFDGQVEIWERMIAILENREFNKAKSRFSTNNIAPPNVQLANRIQKRYSTGNNIPIVSLAEVFDRFVEAHPIKSKRWKLDMRTSFACLLEFKESVQCANYLTKKDFRELLGFIRLMPTQIGNNKKKWKGMSLREIVAKTAQESDFEDNLLHPTTVNKYIGRISQIMQWAENEPLIDRNHARGIRIPKDEIEDHPNRDPFSYTQLNTLFSHDPFNTPNKSEPSIYWACILGLFHGFRSEEILQLRASDIQQDEDGIWFIDIHKRDGNHLKNKSSVRTVPVHPAVFELGFSSLLAAARNSVSESIFPDLVRGSEGRFTSIFSRRFSRYLKNIGVKTDTTSFHSFRHTFRDAARNCEISDSRVSALGGWQNGEGVQASYGAGLSMEEKFKTIKTLEYPRVDFDKVSIIDWS